MALVEKAVADSQPLPISSRTPGASIGQASSIDRLGGPAIRRGNKTVEETAAEHRKRFPKPITGTALAVDIVRSDRDSR